MVSEQFLVLESLDASTPNGKAEPSFSALHFSFYRRPASTESETVPNGMQMRAPTTTTTTTTATTATKTTSERNNQNDRQRPFLPFGFRKVQPGVIATA